MKFSTSLILFLVLVNLAFIYVLNKKVEKLSVLATHKISVSGIDTIKNNTVPSEESVQLSEELSLLSEQVYELAIMLTAIHDESISKKDTIEDLVNDQNQPRELPEELSETLAFGMLDTQAWETMDLSVKQLNKAQNKQFWSEVFNKIALGEVYIPPAE